MKQVGICSIGAEVPATILTNYDLEKMVDKSNDWIVTRTGIRKWRVLKQDEKLLPLLAKTAQTVCEKANLDPAQLDFIINSTLTPDRISSAQACEVARELRSFNSFCFDLNIACSGFVMAGPCLSLRLIRLKKCMKLCR